MSNAGSELIMKGFRQGVHFYGSSLTADARKLLMDSRSEARKRTKPVLDKQLLLLISQDCDINSGSVSSVELLVGRLLRPREIGDSKFYNGRNFQKLYLRINDQHWCFELALQTTIEKDELLTGFVSDADGDLQALDEVNQQILLTWLAAKYTRAPFPHGFNTRFLPYLRNEEPNNLFALCLEKNASHVLDLFAYVSPEDDEAESYEVILVLALKLDVPEIVYTELDQVMSSFVESLHAKFYPALIMKQIEDTAGEILDNVEYVQRPEDFVKSDELKMSSLTLNYLCWPDQGSENCQ
ncbi:hypothetical protein [Vibrio sp. EJY3]|uniref:hypothetical protein n=1 Tax=Vibrio sp. (strain EJY3) TaxID=1116375 RepID=UPI000243B2DF|nr:hypothetical protein [Vibrio sp. EJY3]AEX22442.1 hypothetical protein VEJY3_09810 [Vibrio sp. EJY3]